ncbi:fimbria/pilus periplasmic chaperone [Enterobacter wuhouensis]|uniref:fimbria/pilus periplasmic chaperone n=1 Tax=Enterobacter wuhouensis TaxID=2529381 RepID=UPI003D787BE1
MKYSLLKSIPYAIVAALFILPAVATAGGMSLSGTRIIYPLESSQVSVSVRNTSDKTTYLVQSWAEDLEGSKTKDFIITPPLFSSSPGNENKLRIIYTGKHLPSDHESLYYFNNKAIPSINKKDLNGKNALIFAAITRVKLFVRPAGLKPSPEEAPESLNFKKLGDKLEISNPTPYYLTITNLKSGNKNLKDTMISPFGKEIITLPAGTSSNLTFSTINDYGAITESINKTIK